jgi:hypothetical protein
VTPTIDWRSLKRGTDPESHPVLGRRAFWQSQNYGHVLRDEEELSRIAAYVLGPSEGSIGAEPRRVEVELFPV